MMAHNIANITDRDDDGTGRREEGSHEKTTSFPFFCSHFFPPCGFQAFQVPGLPRPLTAATGAPCEAKKSPFQVARWRPRLMDGRVAPPHPSPFLQWTLFHAGHHHLLRCFAPLPPCLSPAPCRLVSPCPVASRFGCERAAKNGICLAKQ